MVQESSDNQHATAPGVAAPLSLPLHTRLGEFEIISVIGEGGFSIVYLAHDHQLERTVAIKEYLPGAIAYRNVEGEVLPRFEKYDSTFKTGLQSFLKEARILAQFEHHSLIRIHRFWEQNGTAYMVMQYCQGKTMRQILQNDPSRGTDEVWLKQVMAPVLDALRLLHARSCYHRDISPDNIMILDSGAPMLLDFGAARQVIGDMTQALTVILKPGFAPIEQYADDESMRQGPWTDIYGAGAVLYFAVTGKAPTASVARLVKDPLKKLSALPDAPVSPQFAQAIDHALALFPADRPQSVDEFATELLAQDGASSQFQVFPTLSGAAVTASAAAARQQAAEELRVEQSAHASTAGPVALPDASALTPSVPHEPVQEPLPVSPQSVSVPGNAPLSASAGDTASASENILLDMGAPAPDAGNTPAPVAEPPLLPPAQTPKPAVERSTPETPKAATQPQAPNVSASSGSASNTTKPRTSTNAQGSSKRPEPVRTRVKPTQTKRPWGLYAGGGVALLLVLAAAAWMFGDSKPTPDVPPVAQANGDTGGESSPQVVTTGPEPSGPPAVVASAEAVAPTAAASAEPAPLQPITPASVTVAANSTFPPASTPAATSVTIAPLPPVASDTARPGTQPAASAASVPGGGRNGQASLPGTAPGAASGAAIAPDAGWPTGTASTNGSATTAMASEPAVRTEPTPAASGKPGSYVRLSIRPWGKVTVNGVDKGTSPPLVRMWLPEGEHSIVIENGNFPSYSTRVKVVDKKDASVSHRFGG